MGVSLPLFSKSKVTEAESKNPLELTLPFLRGWVRHVHRIALGWILLLVLLSVARLAAQPVSAGWTQGNGFRSQRLSVPSSSKVGFTEVPAISSGITFTNLLLGDSYLTNAVAHNGAGVAIGDVDGDGFQDLFFASLNGENRLYRNLGGWRFQQMDAGAAVCAGQISTGVCFADVDGDGDLDLLINGIGTGTRLFLNDGKGHFTEKENSGLSRTASSTSMALADIDGDGDLDLYCTHFTDAMYLADPTTRFGLARNGDTWEVAKINGESTRAPRWKGRFQALPDGKIRELPEVHGFYRNDGQGHFTPIENEPGTYQDEDGKPIPPFRDWGLAVMFRDLNGDGFPDLYICNDNTSPDRIWINTGKGTFRALASDKIRHTSRSSMGVDIADFDRDGHDDLMVVDMLARDPSRRLRQLMRDRPSLAEVERVFERPQFNRNTLFFGRADGSYVEAALWAGVAATDWTWTVAALDVDLDGYEDLLMTNGFEFDVMNQDSHNQIKDRTKRWTDAQLKRSMQFHPHWRSQNVAFRNRGDGSFEPKSSDWGFDHAGISFGMALADLDNDGDLDLVVNNLNEGPSLYRNEAAAGRVEVRLKGRAPNTAGVGARITLKGGAVVQSQEMIAGGRYLSGGEPVRVFAANATAPETLSLEVRWRSGARSVIPGVQANHQYEIEEPATVNPGAVEAPVAKLPAPWFEDLSAQIPHTHAEDGFDDWSRQITLPRRLGHQGPGIAWFDWDGDGWDELVIGSGIGTAPAVFRNQQGRGFSVIAGIAPARGEMSAVVGWSDGMGGRSLLAAMSNPQSVQEVVPGIAVYPTGATNSAVPESIPTGSANLGSISVADVDGDGDLDVFVAGRHQPGRYPEAVSSAVWLNQGGKLVQSPDWSAAFNKLGLVSGATFVDLNQDGKPDLALTTEWGPVRIFINRGNRFEEATKDWKLDGLKGWWTGIVAGDFNGDGRMDLACGNWGHNSVYALFRPHPLRLFHGEWSGAGVQILECWGSGTNWYPVHDRLWLERGFPGLATEFPTHAAFSTASARDILKSAYDSAASVEASEFSSMVFLNEGGSFKPVALPREAQWAPVFSVNVADVDGDGIDDLFCAQNYFGTATDITREDAGQGLWLKGRGDGTFEAIDASISGIRVPGEQRGAALGDFDHDGRVDLAVTQNGGATRLFANRHAKPGMRVVVKGAKSNPDGIGSQIRILYAGGNPGPTRTLQAGSGHWSQDSATQILGLRSAPSAVWIRWPGGREQTVPVQPDQRSVILQYQE